MSGRHIRIFTHGSLLSDTLVVGELELGSHPGKSNEHFGGFVSKKKHFGGSAGPLPVYHPTVTVGTGAAKIGVTSP